MQRQPSGSPNAAPDTRAATLGSPVPAASATLTGAAQLVSMRLPPVEVEDTTCERLNWRLAFTLALSGQDPDRPGALVPRTLRVQGPGLAQPAVAQLTRQGAESVASLVVPRGGRARAVFQPSVEVVVPASARVGHYDAVVRVTIEGVP